MVTGCNSLLPYKRAATPDRLAHGCSQGRVKFIMGKPDKILECKEGKTMLGFIWKYEDYGWSRDGWENKHGSWDLYLDDQSRFIGWRMTTPIQQTTLTNEDRVRGSRHPWYLVKQKDAPPRIAILEETSAVSRIQRIK